MTKQYQRLGASQKNSQVPLSLHHCRLVGTISRKELDAACLSRQLSSFTSLYISLFLSIVLPNISGEVNAIKDGSECPKQSCVHCCVKSQGCRVRHLPAGLAFGTVNVFCALFIIFILVTTNWTSCHYRGAVRQRGHHSKQKVLLHVVCVFGFY